MTSKTSNFTITFYNQIDMNNGWTICMKCPASQWCILVQIVGQIILHIMDRGWHRILPSKFLVILNAKCFFSNRGNPTLDGWIRRSGMEPVEPSGRYFKIRFFTWVFYASGNFEYIYKKLTLPNKLQVTFSDKIGVFFCFLKQTIHHPCYFCF